MVWFDYKYLVISMGQPMGSQAQPLPIPTETQTHQPMGVGCSHGLMGSNPWWVISFLTHGYALYLTLVVIRVAVLTLEAVVVIIIFGVCLLVVAQTFAGCDTGGCRWVWTNNALITNQRWLLRWW